MKMLQAFIIAATLTVSFVVNAVAFESSQLGTVQGNAAAQNLCRHWVVKVERNATIAQSWLVRHTNGLSGNKLGAGYPQYAKIFDYDTGNGYRTLLVDVGWELRDVNYVIARNPNIHPETKAAQCEANGKQANLAVIELYEKLNPGDKIP